MTNFSWDMAKLRQTNKEIAINKVQARSASNPDFTIAHPDWCRDAAGDNPNYTLLTKKTKEESQKKQKIFQDRRDKLIG